MERNLDFELSETVKIIPLQCEGRIISIWITEVGTKYETRYFLNGSAVNTYLFADELMKVKK